MGFKFLGQVLKLKSWILKMNACLLIIQTIVIALMWANTVQLIGIWLIRVYNSFLQWRTEPNANNHLWFGCNCQILECHSSYSIAKNSSRATRVEVVGWGLLGRHTICQGKCSCISDNCNSFLSQHRNETICFASGPLWGSALKQFFFFFNKIYITHFIPFILIRWQIFFILHTSCLCYVVPFFIVFGSPNWCSQSHLQFIGIITIWKKKKKIREIGKYRIARCKPPEWQLYMRVMRSWRHEAVVIFLINNVES